MRTARASAAAIGLLLLLAGTAPAAGRPLRALARGRGLAVGAAVGVRPLAADPAYRRALAREFDVCVAENAFKWSALRPSPGRYDFRGADAIAAFARRNGMRLRGHTLVWHEQLPAWVPARVHTRDEAVALLREHIETVMGRYRGRVWAWDVVNEAVANDGAGLRAESFWHKTIGPDYVELAFRFARAADPRARLYYNDFDAEGLNPKSDRVYELLRDLKRRGVPVDGVGWQMHVQSGFRTTADHRENARRLAALGLELSVTELDVRVPLPATPEALAAQAETYGDVTSFCLDTPGVRALVTWGFTDAHSWVPGFFKGTGAALPFDERLRPKPAYAAIARALAARPAR